MAKTQFFFMINFKTEKAKFLLKTIYISKNETQQQIHIQKQMGLNLRTYVKNKRVDFNEFRRDNFSNYYFKLGPWKPMVCFL